MGQIASLAGVNSAVSGPKCVRYTTSDATSRCQLQHAAVEPTQVMLDTGPRGSHSGNRCLTLGASLPTLCCRRLQLPGQRKSHPGQGTWVRSLDRNGVRPSRRCWSGESRIRRANLDTNAAYSAETVSVNAACWPEMISRAVIVQSPGSSLGDKGSEALALLLHAVRLVEW